MKRATDTVASEAFMDFGLLLAFRNPPPGQVPFAEIYRKHFDIAALCACSRILIPSPSERRKRSSYIRFETRGPMTTAQSANLDTSAASYYTKNWRPDQ